jgi:superfamily II DNA or RNA helicase
MQNSRQVFVIPAGQGKSRVHAAITSLFLKNTNEKIFVIFENEGLMRRDETQNSQLKIFYENAQQKWNDRVTYRTGINFEPNLSKGVIIIDESDAVMFKDFESYYDNTKYKNLKVIGLTATAYSGQENGVER